MGLLYLCLFSLVPLSFILISVFLISILDFIYLLIFISFLYIYLFFSSLLPCFPCGWLVAEQSRPSLSVFCCRHARREVNDWVDQMHIPLIHLLWGFTYHTTTYACTGKIQGSTIVPVRTLCLLRLSYYFDSTELRICCLFLQIYRL